MRFYCIEYDVFHVFLPLRIMFAHALRMPIPTSAEPTHQLRIMFTSVFSLCTAATPYDYMTLSCEIQCFPASLHHTCMGLQCPFLPTDVVVFAPELYHACVHHYFSS